MSWYKWNFVIKILQLYSEIALSRKVFGIGYKYIYTFCLEWPILWPPRILTFPPGAPCIYIYIYRSFAITVSKIKIWIFQEKRLKVLKCCNFLWVQRRHNCSPAASFTNCVMTFYYIKNQLDAALAVLFISHCKITLHVSDAFCIHHQEY